MGTTASKLTKLAETKEAIRIAIESKGVEVSTSEPFSAYPAKINAIAGGVGRSLITINVTLDGAANRITEGATISVTNNATGEVVERVWDGSTIQIVVESLSEYSIECSKITSYSSPKKVTFIPANGVSYDYTLDYITPPVGVYLLTTDDELIAPADWRSSYECEGIYVGQTGGNGLYYEKVVLSPEAVTTKITSVTKANWGTITNGITNGYLDEYPKPADGNWIRYRTCGPASTKFMVDNYGTFEEVWNYKFKSGGQAYIPSIYDLRLIFFANIEDIKNAYSAIGFTFPFTTSGKLTDSWSVNMLSSSPGILAVSSTLQMYGWLYGERDDGWNVSNNYTQTIALRAY